jgi:uncharacterized protein
MDVTPLIREGQQIIQSYDGGCFKISGKTHEGGVIVSPDKTREWDAEEMASLTAEDFQPLIDRADEIDVLLLGTGGQFEFIENKLKNQLSDAGLPVDVMDTGAACRTYNVLMAEGRRVVAALLPTG